MNAEDETLLAKLRSLTPAALDLVDRKIDEMLRKHRTWRSRLFGTELCRVFILPQGLRIVRWFPR